MMGEYALDVDYSKIAPFKRAMQAVADQTLDFPLRTKHVAVSRGEHGAVYEYVGNLTHKWCSVQEGLGNKNYIAEWMYQHAGTGLTYYEGIGIDTILMAVNDLICQGAVPVIYTDEVAAGDSEWFMDEKRAAVLADSFFMTCSLLNMALPAGESPSLRYLIKSEMPVKSAPSLSGCAIGIISPRDRMVTGRKLQVGDSIMGVRSSGIHANGISLVIRRALQLKDGFLHMLPNGSTLGDEALIPTCSYVNLVSLLFDKGVDIHALLPGTGGGVAKIAYDKRPFTYRIHSWVTPPPIFQFMREIGVSLEDCLTTFNWGIGFYIFVPESEVERVWRLGKSIGYDVLELGRVEEGERKVIFMPENITLPPPGE